jgi:hypothetical protein
MIEADLAAGRTKIARVFGGVDLLAAVVAAVGVFGGLPARWWPVDTCAAIVIALLAAAGVGLLARTPWGPRIARIASFVALGMGLLLIGILAITASYLSGIYGPVGRGGAIILILVAALALPYLVALPLAQLFWLGGVARSDSARAPARAREPRRDEERASETTP